MEMLDVIKARRSIRKFKPDPVSDDNLTAILEAARLAPSGTNIQPWRFVVIKTEETKNKLAGATPLPFVPAAPIVIACCIDSQALNTVGQRMKELSEAGAFTGTPLDNKSSDTPPPRRQMDESTAQAYLWLNLAIAIDHMTLRAVDLGLGTCWVMMFDKDKVKQILQLEDRYSVVALLPVGYADQSPATRPRFDLNTLKLKEL